MKTMIVLPLAALGLALAGISQARIADPLRERGAQAAPGKQTLAYGTDPRQKLDFYAAQRGKGPAPLVLFVHGGGWTRGTKDIGGSRSAPGHFTGLGYAYASIDYRLVPNAGVEQQADDVAAALKALFARAKDLGIDRRRVAVIGHSAGAHLVALVATDEQYLRRAGLSFADLDGVIPNDGAAYDVPAKVERSGRFAAGNDRKVFGTDPERQRALSPTLHAAAPNAPAFLLIHVQRPDSMAQAKDFEVALRRAGTSVERHEFAGSGLRGHMEINRRLGEPGYPATRVVDAWLKRVLGN